jgi:hypothetical protein
MKTKSLEKLATLFVQSMDEEVKKVVEFSIAKGGYVYERDKAALEAGFQAGWNAALAMIALHDLK